MSVITLLYTSFMPVISRRYTSKWRYIIWLMIAVFWILPFPFFPRVNLSFIPVQMQDISLTPLQPIINALPSISDTGDIVNTSSTISIWLVLIFIWIIGVISKTVFHALRHRYFMKMVRRWSNSITDLEHLELLNNLKSELSIKTQVELSVCQTISSPMLVGYFRPTIILPPINLAGNELSLILKHELIHLKRHDLWFKLLILTATALHWFNPVVYLMAKATALQCEISCDARVLQSANFQQRKQYGEMIIGVVRNGAKLHTALSTNFYGGKRGMEKRIASILDVKPKKAGFAVLCMVFIAFVTFGVTGMVGVNNYNYKSDETHFSLNVPQGWTVVEEPRIPAGQDWEATPDDGIRMLLADNENNFIHIFSQYGTISIPSESEYVKEDFTTAQGVKGSLYKSSTSDAIWYLILKQDIAPDNYGAVVRFENKELLTKEQENIIKILESIKIYNP